MSLMPARPARKRHFGAGGASPARLPLGSLITTVSDGTMAEATSPGVRNCISLALMAMNGRLMPSESHNLGRSGDDLDLEYARLPFVTGQAPAVLVRGSAGHNDGLMSTDPASGAGIALMAKWTRNVDWLLANASPLTGKIVLATTIGSLVGGEAAYATSVNAAQKAYITAKAASDARIALWDAWPLYNHTNCAALSPASDGLRVHPDNRGGWALAFGDGVHPGLFAVLDGLVTAATAADMQTWLDSNTLNVDVDTLLSGGTTGSKAGTIVPSGSWPSGKRITNGMTNGSGVALACSVIDQAGFKQAVASASGTPAASATVTMDDTIAIPLSGSTPGQFFAPAVRLMLGDGVGGGAKGLVNFSLSMGNFANIGNTTDQSAVVTGDVPAPIDWIIIAQPNPVFGSNGPMSGNPSLTLRARGGIVQNWEATIEKPRLFRLYAAPRTLPLPLWKAPGIGVNLMQRLSGTISNGQTIRVEPGLWSGGGLNNATFITRRIFQGDITDIGVGMGTELAALSGATWTWTAAGLTSGSSLWLDVAVSTSSGSVTARAGPFAVP